MVRCCCNNQWDLVNLPIVDMNEFHKYDEVLITGGEPMLRIDRILAVTSYTINNVNTSVYMYTADVSNLGEIIWLLGNELDGITVTLHNQEDVGQFMELDAILGYTKFPMSSSFRLNVFKGVDVPYKSIGWWWKVKKDIEWINPCPLPKDEVLKRLEDIS